MGENMNLATLKIESHSTQQDVNLYIIRQTRITYIQYKETKGLW